MPRSRVLSFMSQWGGGQPRSPTHDVDKPFKTPPSPSYDFEGVLPKRPPPVDTASPQAFQQRGQFGPSTPGSPTTAHTQSRARGDSRPSSRPMSMIQTYQPYQVEVAHDTPPELQPIFSYLNSHSNKLYQEGYFLKLHDLDSRGRPSADRVWNECFAQLVGTVLSLWDAAALDQAGEEGEVVPTFINLSDASIKMVGYLLLTRWLAGAQADDSHQIESLPMNGAQGGNLQNVLSVSTAANNRYLLHFNSLNSLTQWTAGIRLAMFEHSTLQEAYTGSMIAGKGRYLNSIRQIMDRSRFAYEDWIRVRFGAGTPWKRYWCVISPPDEKEYQKAQKVLKKPSSYSRAQIPKGDIKFYDTRKVTKKTRPVATIKDAFAAYAIYPQSKPLIDQSTLVKLEGLITIHTGQETTTEGFVFAMPEVHAAVSGFEMMLQWLFRVYDTFALYGRPIRLISDALDQRGLMFAMPDDRRYGYLDTLDVSALIHTDGSQNWSERQWRKEMKSLTSKRMTARLDEGWRPGQRRSTMSRASLPPQRNAIQFQEPTIHSSPGSRSGSPARVIDNIKPPKRNDSAPPPSYTGSPHKRAASEVSGYWKHKSEAPSRLSHEASRPVDFEDEPPAPPRHGVPLDSKLGRPPPADVVQRSYSGDSAGASSPYEQLAAPGASPSLPPPAPVVIPPAMTHSANSRPQTEPYQDPDLRRAQSNVDEATLHELQSAIRPSHDDGSVPLQMANVMPHGVLPYRDQRNVPVGGHSSDVIGYADDGSGWQHRNGTERLSTIPASPFTGHETEYFQSSQQAQMPRLDGVMDAVDEKDSRPELISLQSSHSIARKPLPNQQSHWPAEAEPNAPYQQVRAMSPNLPDSPVSGAESFYDAVVNHDALELILNNDSSRASTFNSAATPDYASVESASQPHQERKKEKEWRRTGKLKTVGDPDLPVIDTRHGSVSRLDTYNKDIAEQTAEMPTIDFGPTYTYQPHSRPDTGGTLPTGERGQRRSRSRSADRLRQSSGSKLSDYFVAPSPVEQNRHSYFGGMAMPQENLESPSHRHSIAWLPGLASGGISPNAAAPKRTLSPEEWVAYRASLAAQPHGPQRKSPVSLLAHQRQPSNKTTQQLRHSMSRTPPPFARGTSGDWSQARNQTPPSRPNSRGAGAHLNQSPVVLANQSTASLSAKEQMEVARATGSPLVELATQDLRQASHSSGLVGVLAAREKEKTILAQGARSVVVQNAINARQQQQQQQQYQMEGEAQAQYEIQQRAQQQQAQTLQQQQQQQQQQMAYRNSILMNHRQSMSFHPQQPRSEYTQGRTQSMQVPVQQNFGGFGGQYVQQQQQQQYAGMQVQQTGYGGGNYYSMQQGRTGQGWQQPRR